jgi:hypothetical protein
MFNMTLPPVEKEKVKIPDGVMSKPGRKGYAPPAKSRLRRNRASGEIAPPAKSRPRHPNAAGQAVTSGV